jgi:CheY-like chemotaxis protein
MDKSPDSKPNGKTILIVDDEFGVLEVVEFILVDLGYTVISALNGRDALARLAESPPDLILLDFMMPIMDGAAFLKSMRSDPRYCNVPVILTSALPEQTIKNKCSGYNLFLRKPYKFEQLIEGINSVLQACRDSRV